MFLWQKMEAILLSYPYYPHVWHLQRRVVWGGTISLQVGAREARKQTLVVTSVRGHLICRKVPCSRSFSVWEESTTNVWSEAWTYHLIIFCEKPQKKQGLFWEWGYQHHHHKFHPQYSAMCGGVDNKAGHCRAMSTVKSLLMSDRSI